MQRELISFALKTLKLKTFSLSTPSPSILNKWLNLPIYQPYMLKSDSYMPYTRDWFNNGSQQWNFSVGNKEVVRKSFTGSKSEKLINRMDFISLRGGWKISSKEKKWMSSPFAILAFCVNNSYKYQRVFLRNFI